MNVLRSVNSKLKSKMNELICNKWIAEVVPQINIQELVDIIRKSESLHFMLLS